MAGSALKDARVVAAVKKDFVAALVDRTDPAEEKWVSEHGVAMTPHLVIADAEGSQWGFLSDVHGADDVLATMSEALKLMAESGDDEK